MAPLNPSSKPYADQVINSAFKKSPNNVDDERWHEGPEFYRHNSKTNMSSLRPSNLLFSEPLPAPPGLPIRPPSQTPAFEKLDSIYEKSPRHLLGAQGVGFGGYNENEDESHNKDALRMLENHIKARTPYIQLASSRLQAATSVRNDSPFDLPEPPKLNLSLHMQGPYTTPNQGFPNFSKPSDKGGVKAKSVARGNGRIDSGIGFIPKSPIGMQAVDKETGKGLRKFLLQKGKECGMRKLECKSISFHDFTPDMRSGNHQNVLLGHYGAENGQRVDAYEVDLPTTQVNPETGEESLATETWLWILISRSMLSSDPSDTMAFVPERSPNLTSTASDIFYTPYSQASNYPEPLSIHPTPPNFPKPTPLSWVVFAAPKAHLITYPEATESHEERASPYPFITQTLTINKRIDYDFSFSGIPLFEFSSADIFHHASKRTEFLSIDRMGGWCENDLFQDFTEDEYRRMYSLWEDGETGVGGFDAEGFPKAPMPVPNRGVWWKVFYDRLNEDVVRWKKVRTAMGRGKCRVVLRWIEAIDEKDAEAGQHGGAIAGKQGVGTVEKKGMNGKRLTRSETRRRSGLAMSDPPVGLAIGGIIGMGAL